MTKFIVVFVSFNLISIVQGNSSSSAQDTTYFSHALKLDATVRPFCSNPSNDDFAPFAWNDKIFITSSRLTSKNKNNINPLTKQPFLHVYAFNKNCDPVDLKFLPSTINTDLNCGPISVASDTSVLVITKNYARPNAEQVQDLYLAYYVRENKKWSEEKMFPFNNIRFSLQHPCFDNQTKTLYFSSNLPGGYGKFDLYKSKWNGKNWSQPENLGPEINSSSNEVFPSTVPDGGLIYTSDHSGVSGGLDLVLYKNGKRYLLPQPFNTSREDFSMTFTDNSSGYFSSNRDSLSGKDKIYSFKIHFPDSATFLIRVVDKETQIPVPKVTVAFKSANPVLDQEITTSAQGEGILHRGIENSFPVSFELTKAGYLPLKTVSDNFQAEADQRVITLAMQPKPVQEDTLIVIGIRPVFDYYVVVGSFKDMSVASQKAEALSNQYNADFIVLPPTKEGNVRVSYGKYSTPEEAKVALQSIRTRISSNAWIFANKK